MKKALLIFFLSFYLALPCSAALLNPDVQSNINYQSGLVAQKGGYANAEGGIWAVVASILNVVLSLLGIIFVILVIKSGFEWMTAEGDSKKVETAKSRIQTAIVGLIIVVSAYSITTFIFSHLPETGGGNTSTSGGTVVP